MFKKIDDWPSVNSSTGARLIVPLLLLLCYLIGYGANSPTAQVAQPQNPASIITLEPDKAIQSEITGGQLQSYRITPSAGQFVSVVVRQRGIDVLERLFAPDGKLVALYDSEYRPQEAESAEFVAETPGAYRLDVKAKIKNASGRYEIRVAEVRPASEPDRWLHEAHRLSTESSRSVNNGKYEEAISYSARALEAAEKALGTSHVYVAYLLRELANRQRLKGDIVKAEASIQRALSINEKLLGPEHPQTVESLHVLALVYQRKGDYAKAAQMLEQALEITGRTLGTEHPEFVDQLISLGTLRSDLADLVQAERVWQRALTIAEKTQEANDSRITNTLNNLGMLYLLKKDYEHSEPLLLRALANDERKLGPEHPSLIAPLINLGRLARERKNYPLALARYQRALAIAEKAYGPDSPDAGALLNNIANLHKAKGDYETPLPLYERVLKISERSLGRYDGLAILALGNIANLYAARGDIGNAISFQERVDQRIEGTLALNLVIGSERQKLAYFSSLADRTDRTVSLHVRLAPGDRSAGALAALVLLQRKGRILDAMSDNLTALRNRFDAQDQKLLDQLNSTTAQLAKLALNGPQKTAPDEYQKHLSSLEEQKEKLETEISQRSSEFRAQTQPVTLAAVQAAIPPGAALVEFATFRPFNPRAENNSEAYGQAHYVVYVMRNQGDVQWQELGAVKEIDTRVDELRQALRDPQRKDVQRLARAVDEQVMQPVRGLTGDARQLLISPDGELNLIPFAALVDEQGHYLLERYEFDYLTSGRDLLRLQVGRASKSPPVVIADPAFGEPALIASHGAGPGADAGGRAQLDYSQIFFGPLPGVGDEVRALKHLLPQATFLTKEQATKAALQHVRAPSILHIATHGFFLQNDPPAGKQPAAQLKDQTRLAGWGARVENPLLRSGLALAGANQARSENDDGVLTAFEASGLDLWGTKLVVLSACDTGLGEVRKGEGVYGLRRALVLAGSESQMISLWAVSDRSTRDLIVGYYTALMQGAGRSEALRQVQLRMLHDKSRGHPYYWAGFILSGQWAKL